MRPASAFFLATAVILSAPACQAQSKAPPADATALQKELEATAQYEVLLRRLLTDPDPVTVESALFCESRHVLHELGSARLGPALNAAEARAYSASDRPKREEISARMANQVFGAPDSLCRRLGREEYLKDTTWIVGNAE